MGQGGLGLSARDTALPEQLCGVFLDAYAAALGRGKARWVDRDTAPSPVSDLLQAARQRSRPDFLDSRTLRTAKRRRIRLDGIKALPATPQQKFAVTAFMDDYAARQDEPGFFKVLDVARRIAGTGSMLPARRLTNADLAADALAPPMPEALSDTAARRALLRRLIELPGAPMLLVWAGERVGADGHPVLRVEVASADGLYATEHLVCPGRSARQRDLLRSPHRRWASDALA